MSEAKGHGMDNPLDNTLDGVIERLTGDLRPVRGLAHPGLRAAAWIGLCALYVAGAAVLRGLRVDLADKAGDLHFLFEVGLMALTGLSAALASFWLAVPDARGRRGLSAGPLALFAAFLLWSALRVVTEGVSLEGLRINDCLQEGVIMGFVPAFALVLFSRRGATTHPVLLSVMNALAVAGFGYVGLRVTCAADAVEHATIFHLAPFMLADMLLALAARRLYRW
jgi:hypothetical protein